MKWYLICDFCGKESAEFEVLNYPETNRIVYKWLNAQTTKKRAEKFYDLFPDHLLGGEISACPKNTCQRLFIKLMK